MVILESANMNIKSDNIALGTSHTGFFVLTHYINEYIDFTPVSINADFNERSSKNVFNICMHSHYDLNRIAQLY